MEVVEFDAQHLAQAALDIKAEHGEHGGITEESLRRAGLNPEDAKDAALGFAEHSLSDAKQKGFIAATDDAEVEWQSSIASAFLNGLQVGLRLRAQEKE